MTDWCEVSDKWNGGVDSIKGLTIWPNHTIGLMPTDYHQLSGMKKAEPQLPGVTENDKE